MEFATFRNGDVLRINVLVPRIDAACAIQFKDRMRKICEDAPPCVLLDMQLVDFLDSSGLGAVVASMKHLGSDRRLELAGLSPKVSKVFRLTRMDSIFSIHDTADDIVRFPSDAD